MNISETHTFSDIIITWGVFKMYLCIIKTCIYAEQIYKAKVDFDNFFSGTGT